MCCLVVGGSHCIEQFDPPAPTPHLIEGWGFPRISLRMAAARRKDNPKFTSEKLATPNDLPWGVYAQPLYILAAIGASPDSLTDLRQAMLEMNKPSGICVRLAINDCLRSVHPEAPIVENDTHKAVRLAINASILDVCRRTGRLAA